jgi:GT2 family glycosyltransferase
LVTVVIPSYDSARTIELCVRAVARQTYAPIEIIVVDDGSTDGSAEIAARVARALNAPAQRAPAQRAPVQRVTLLRTGANAGQAAARNLGARRATGDVLFFLDADIVLAPGSVAAAVAELGADPGLGAICGVLDPEPLLPTGLAARYRAAQQFVWFDEADGAIPGLHVAMCGLRAEVFREVGPFDPGLRYTEDQEYGYRLRRRYDVRATRAVHGRHDHRDPLRRILGKVFHRTRLGMPLWLAHRSLPGGAATGSRALASVAALAAALSVPSPLLVGPVGAGATAALLGAAVALDAGTYRHVFADRGAAFGLYFVGVHLLVNLTTAVAAGLGAARYVVRRRPARPAEARPSPAVDVSG